MLRDVLLHLRTEQLSARPWSSRHLHASDFTCISRPIKFPGTNQVHKIRHVQKCFQLQGLKTHSLWPQLSKALKQVLKPLNSGVLG